MFVRSERLFLRPGWPEDSPELLALIDEEIVRNLASAPWPSTAEDALGLVSAARHPRLPRFLVTLPGADGSRVIGACGLGPAGEDVELGFWIGREARDRGYAAEAGRALLPLARALGHARIVASHFLDNPASGRVLAKIGFRPTGRVMARFSRGRGATAAAAEFAIDLACDDPCSGNSSGPKVACTAA
jgi:RimJ/RimL family protein N-acetyltransferase